MAEIVRNRTIRPSSRLAKFKSYKIDTKTVLRTDSLVVNIDHESKSFRKTFRFTGGDVANKDSISFRIKDLGNTIDINWTGAQPISNALNFSSPKLISEKTKKQHVVPTTTHLKTSFAPVSNLDITVLVLGTIPGDKSIELNEYYGHPRNKFWKIISNITDNEIPNTYSDKIALLNKTKIAVWDVAHRAVRKGSLDSEIKNEIPNNLNDFISQHKKLATIAFNGVKAETLFNKYFVRDKEIKYVSLPSSSPANTSIGFDNICKKWHEILR